MNKYILFLLFLLSFIYHSHILASAIEVTPTKVFFNPDQKYTFITIKNLSNEQVFAQAEQLDWQQENSKDIYTQSNDLLISPIIFSIKSKGEQILRIGRKKMNTDNNIEKSYRLLISEIPDQFQHNNGLKMVLRLSIPIFIEPNQKTEHELQWSKKITHNNSVNINLYNPNNYHKMVTKIELKDKLNQDLYKQQNAFIYLLPKQKHTWTIAKNPKLVEHIKNESLNDENSIAMILNTPNGLSNATAVNEQNINPEILLTKSEVLSNSNNQQDKKNKT